jgi:hypothetical protein
MNVSSITLTYAARITLMLVISWVTDPCKSSSLLLNFKLAYKENGQGLREPKFGIFTD